MPHRPRARIALDDVNGRIAPSGVVVVAWRHIHLQGTFGGIAERIVRQQLADDGMPFNAAGQRSLVGVRIRGRPDDRLGHPRDATAPDSIRVRARVATTTIGWRAAP
jgi:hypothetical protein